MTTIRVQILSRGEWHTLNLLKAGGTNELADAAEEARRMMTDWLNSRALPADEPMRVHTE